MDWIIGSGLRFGRLVVALAIGLTVIGIAQLHSAPVDVYPEFMPPSVEIQTEALGLSAAEVEQLVTVPLEQDLLNGVPWLDRIHSSSMPGLSAIDLTFRGELGDRRPDRVTLPARSARRPEPRQHAGATVTPTRGSPTEVVCRLRGENRKTLRKAGSCGSSSRWPVRCRGPRRAGSLRRCPRAGPAAA